MALVDVLDPFTRRSVPMAGGAGAPRRAEAGDEGKHSGAGAPSGTVDRFADARWVAVSPALDAGRVLALLESHGAEHAMVFERGLLAGVLCSCDLIDSAPSDPIYGLMSRRVITIEWRASVWVAAKIMAATGVGCLPVSDGARVVGLVDRDRLFAAGIPFEATGPVCSCCGSHRHVPLRGPRELRLCLDCLDWARPAEPFDAALDRHELGAGG